MMQPISHPHSPEKRILLFLHDVTLEERLQTKYRTELSKKESVIDDLSRAVKEKETALTNLGKKNIQLDQKVFEISLLLDILH
jgi:hypothetical protein